MNLVSFSIKTKGVHNFARRLWTVFTRFGFSEVQTRKALQLIVEVLRPYNSAPTFFIPAVVLRRHAGLITEIASRGAEIGIHGYVHNDYRTLNKFEQYNQTEQAISVFQNSHISHQGFRNPYLGWTEESLEVFSALGFIYESNEAVLHELIDPDSLSPLLKSGYEKSLALFQAIPCSIYTLRPHFEGNLLRLPTSIPDDEMLFDRLRITDPKKVGDIWSKIMERVYQSDGLYILNLHPERGLLCKQALATLLAFASSQPLPIWLTRLQDIAQWWKERSQFKLTITPLTDERWRVEADCTSRAALLARHFQIEDQPTTPWHGADVRVQAHDFQMIATKRPCIGLSAATPQQVADFLQEQGYPFAYCPQEEADTYALYLDLPAGLEGSREEQIQKRSTLVQKIEQVEEPLLHFGCWPDGNRAALAVTGDIDSVTIQDFFLRIFEVRQTT